MAEKRENSVLFSLRELRQIEEDRIKSEEEAVRQREEDERARVAAEVRRQKEEEDRKRREIEDAERARVESEQQKEREDRLRVEEARQRAQVDAQARLEGERLKLEIDARAREASSKKAKILVLGSVAAFVLAVGGVVAAKVSKDRADARAAEAAIANQRVAEEEAKRVAQQKEFDGKLAQIRQDNDEIAAKVDAVNKSKSTEERQRLNDELARIRQAKAEHEAQLQRMREDRAKAPVKVSCTDPNNPLCGIQ